VYITALRTPASPDELVDISKGMSSVKLCSNIILQFLTGGASYHRLSYIMAVKWLFFSDLTDHWDTAVRKPA